MNITISQIVVWLVVGALAGHLVGSLMTFKREGLGRFTNLGLGLAGAVFGGVLFRVFNINLGLADVSISAEDLVAAVIGSLLLFAGYGIWKRLRRKKT